MASPVAKTVAGSGGTAPVAATVSMRATAAAKVAAAKMAVATLAAKAGVAKAAAAKVAVAKVAVVMAATIRALPTTMLHPHPMPPRHIRQAWFRPPQDPGFRPTKTSSTLFRTAS